MKSKPQTMFTGIIPARYASSRFPGKPLAIIGGKTMIERVYEQASQALEEVWVATDDERIKLAVSAFGGKVIMTSTEHRSGTDRCAEAVIRLSGNLTGDESVVINIQGDEPFINPMQINLLKDCFNDPEVQIATLVRKVTVHEDLTNINHPKVVLSDTMDALYFSRSVIPYCRDSQPEEWVLKHIFFKHIGLYGYRIKTLLQITQLAQTNLELAENLEQLRWLGNGFHIRCAVTPWESMGIDTPDDLLKAEAMLLSRKG